MVDISDFIEPDGTEEADDGADLEALKGCLQALADAIASTNIAVLSGAQGDPSAAMTRVQASVGALKRFHENFVVLKGPVEADEEEAGEE